MKTVQKMTVEDFEWLDSVESVILDHKREDVEAVWMSGDEECPYVGVSYKDDTCSIVGMFEDHMVTFKEMIECLTEF